MGEFLMGVGYLLGGIVHLWTVVIAMMEAGFIGAILTFIFPVLSEIYWVFTLWGINDAYVNTALIATVLVLLGPFFPARG